MLLGDKTDWYLRAKKEVATVQGKDRAGYCLS